MLSTKSNKEGGKYFLTALRDWRNAVADKLKQWERTLSIHESIFPEGFIIKICVCKSALFKEKLLHHLYLEFQGGHWNTRRSLQTLELIL